MIREKKEDISFLTVVMAYVSLLYMELQHELS